MNRRQFLKAAIAGLPVLAAPAALLEAIEPKRTIFLPPRGGWLRYSGFEFIDVEAIIKKALAKDAAKSMDRLMWVEFNKGDMVDLRDTPLDLTAHERHVGLRGLNQILDGWTIKAGIQALGLG